VEYRYTSTLSLTSALDEGSWSTPRPGRFTPEKQTRYPLYRRLGGPQCRSGRGLKISSPPGFDPRTVQPVASRYTENAIIYVCIYTYAYIYMLLYIPIQTYASCFPLSVGLVRYFSSHVLWDVTLCSSVDRYQHFKDIFYFLQVKIGDFDPEVGGLGPTVCKYHSICLKRLRKPM
jgi:hypothetical protein